jgi:hypothetical protein
MHNPYGIPMTMENIQRLRINPLNEDRQRMATTVLQRHKEMQLLQQMLILYTDLQLALDEDPAQDDSYASLSGLAGRLLDPVRQPQFRPKSHVRQRINLALDAIGNPLSLLRRGLRTAIRRNMCRHGINESLLGRVSTATAMFDAAHACRDLPGGYGIGMPSGMAQGLGFFNPLSAILPELTSSLSNGALQLFNPLMRLTGPLTTIPKMLLNYPELLALYAIRDRYIDTRNPGCTCLTELLPQIIDSRERTYFNAAISRHPAMRTVNAVSNALGHSPFLPPDRMSPHQRAAMLLTNAVGDSGTGHENTLRLPGWPQWKGCPMAMLILATVCATGNPRQGAQKAVVAMCAREETSVAAIYDYM